MHFNHKTIDLKNENHSSIVNYIFIQFFFEKKGLGDHLHREVAPYSKNKKRR